MPTETITTLSATSGRETGTRVSGRLRVSGRTPITVYGKGFDAVTASVDSRELRILLNGPEGLHPTVTLDLDGKKITASVHVIQKHPVRHNVIHVDFLVKA